MLYSHRNAHIHIHAMIISCYFKLMTPCPLQKRVCIPKLKYMGCRLQQIPLSVISVRLRGLGDNVVGWEHHLYYIGLLGLMLQRVINLPLKYHDVNANIVKISMCILLHEWYKHEGDTYCQCSHCGRWNLTIFVV